MLSGPSTIASKGKGTRSGTGAGRSTRIDFRQEDRLLDALSAEERHRTGHMYKRSNGTVYDPREILRSNYFWFEPARRTRFAINDCLVHAVNYLFRHPIFVTRD
jgi:hypothetical protein